MKINMNKPFEAASPEARPNKAAPKGSGESGVHSQPVGMLPTGVPGAAS